MIRDLGGVTDLAPRGSYTTVSSNPALSAAYVSEPGWHLRCHR
jgi:hypothetical protein